LDCFCFFFFQAEDGIRDRNVTGVQTCALPILLDFISTDILSEEPSGNNGQNSGQADNGNHDENQNEETDLNELKEQLEKWEDKEDELTALMMDVETFLEEEDLE